MARADQLDAEFRAATTLAEKTEETVRDLQKKMQHVENELDITLEKLTQTTTKLDEKEKAYAVAEGEIQALKRKIALLEDELERYRREPGSLRFPPNNVWPPAGLTPREQ